MKLRLALATLLLVACGSEAAPAPVAEVAVPAAPPTPPPAPTPPPVPVVEVAVPAPADPSAAELPDVSDPAALCAAYYDAEVRDALARTEAGALEHPGVTIRSSLGVGTRAPFIAACSAQPPERLRCFTAYAAAHMDECLAVLLAPTPEMATLVPLNNQTVEDLRALAATLPPAAE